MRARVLGALGAALLGVAAAAPGDERPGAWDDLLRAEGLVARDVHLAPDRWREGGPHALRCFERAWDDWTTLEPDTLATARSLIAAAPSFERLLDVAGGLADIGTAARTVELAPVISLTLADAIAALASRTGEPLDAARRADLDARAARVPEDVAARASVVLAAVPPALDALDRALARFQPKDVPAAKRCAIAYEKALAFGRYYSLDETTLALVESFDRDALFEGARLLARAVDAASAPFASPHGDFHFEWPTAIGTIALSGDGADRYEAGPYLLVVDTAGDDVYRPALPKDPERYPIAIALDFAGSDRWEGPGLAFGAGVLGYGFLLDAAGDDVYDAEDVGPGSGILGVGIAIDRAGRDEHSVHLFGQGAGVLGVGVLADLEGADVYRCFGEAQGYGGTLGVGALVDLAGDDRYEANDTKLERPSPQTAQHNTSLAQGAGFGRRAHPGDGHSMAGGAGFLVDAKGDDRYRCGVFGQGTGYWFALGALVDLEGEDDYEGVWYVQGSAAHSAVAALIDAKGDDRFHATTQSQGHGHDASVGLLADLGGDDDYTGGGLCLGTGNWGGVGLFRDDGGTDRFAGSTQSFGWAESPPPGVATWGLFLARSTKATFAPARPERVKDAPAGLRRLRRVTSP